MCWPTWSQSFHALASVATRGSFKNTIAQHLETRSVARDRKRSNSKDIARLRVGLRFSLLAGESNVRCVTIPINN